MYTVTAADDSFQKDPNLYSDLHERFAETITIDNSLISRAAKFRLPGIYLSWHIRAYREIIKKWGKKQFDCIVTFSHPIVTNLLGLLLKKYFKKPWIAFFSDTWVDNPFTEYKGITKKVNLYFERAVMKMADIIVFTCPEMQNFFEQKYPFITRKTAYLEHSYDPSLYEQDSEQKNDMLVFRHIGGLYGENRWGAFRNLATTIGELVNANLGWKNKLRIEIIGYADDVFKDITSEISKKYQLNGMIQFKTEVAYLESLKFMKESNVLIVLDIARTGSVHLLSKLVDYIGAGCPILAIAPKNGTTSRVISQVGGWIVEPNDMDGMAKVINDILVNYKNGTLQQFSPSTEMAQEYSISRHIDKFINILNGKIKG